MSAEKESVAELEQLSRMLDELNAGHRPECPDRKTAELLETADLVRRESPPVPPPQYILDQAVDRALAGIQAGRRKKQRVWWYSTALSSAAAVILVIGLNLLPAWRQQVVAPALQTVSSTEQEILPTNPGGEQPAPGAQNIVVQAPNPAKATPEQTAPPPAKAAPTQPVPNTASKQPKPPATDAVTPPPDTIFRSGPARIMTETAPQKRASKSVSPGESLTKSVAPTMSPLKLPGQTPELVVTDQDTGTIRQLYFKGTSQELTIIQRLRPPNSVGRQTASEGSDINTVQVAIAGQDVTLSGRQSQQDLLKIAASLTP